MFKTFFRVLARKKKNVLRLLFFSNRITHYCKLYGECRHCHCTGAPLSGGISMGFIQKKKNKKWTWVLFVCFIVISNHINALKIEKNRRCRTDKPFAAHWQLCQSKSSKSQTLWSIVVQLSVWTVIIGKLIIKL